MASLPGSTPFIDLYYRGVAAEDVDRSRRDLEGAALSHLRLGQQRTPGTALCRVLTPSLEIEGWESPHTVVEVVCDDMPFLVDSVVAELTRHDLAIQRVVHPQINVSRDAVGHLKEVLPAPAEGSVSESFIQVEVDRQEDEGVLGQVRNDIRRVLEDVRAAVEDWEKMRLRTQEVVDMLTANRPPTMRPEDAEEAAALLTWLQEDHFTFLGFREYELTGEGETQELRSVSGSGLGILRDAGLTPLSRSFAALPPEVRSKVLEPTPLTISKANTRSTVHRPSYLDYIGAKVFDADGRVIGEKRILGLFSRSAYADPVTTVPVVRRTVRDVVRRANFTPVSHDAKHLRQILEDYPRDDLLQISSDELYETALGILHLQERRRVRLFVREDAFGRFVSCIVFLPRERFSTEVRHRVQEVLSEHFGGTTVDYELFASDSVLLRLHLVVRKAEQSIHAGLDLPSLEQKVAAATRTWDDDLCDELVEAVGETRARGLIATYARAFPEAFKEDFRPRIGVLDALRLEAMDEDGIDLALYRAPDNGPTERRFKIFRVGEELSLATLMPLLADMGAVVGDERPYGIDRPGRLPAWIYDFGLSFPGVDPEVLDGSRDRFQESFASVWSGRAESDALNALVLRACLDWRSVVVLRAYTKYLRQTGTLFSDAYLQQALIGNSEIAGLLVDLFTARMDPNASGDADAIVAAFKTALDEVASLDEDRMLRSYLTLVMATVRTNHFQTDGGVAKGHLSIKLDPTKIPDLVQPRPRHEVFVYSPRVEGVHLRFGAVARGGIRWSDRREDFRTEVLGLVKAQTVKNAVIVPVGAKGGFIAKRADPSYRDAWMAEGIEAYKIFIRGLLDLTDNVVDGVIVPPKDTVRHDGDDPYLVVAADKGTATFSDIANGLALEYGFWLGDAFASGGSHGYDHKAMGITAKGAWESVKRHFRELGDNIQTQPLTVVGIGDMSGDVFGNGMLLSEQIKLVAAFDHRHIFIDPTPDPKKSFAERKRMFDLPRSSWADYKPELISAGGGIYPRTLKSIEVSPQAAHALGIEPGAMTPAELMRAILVSPNDLLWNGGIGTYVKASSETNTSVGDKANDSIRVNGKDLKAKVVGEGGNLGFTQLGRVEFATNGGHINNDAVDNSAGVDTSDHEVNIKILLSNAITAGTLKPDERDPLLKVMTDEVAALVLTDNYDQNVALGNARAQARSMLPVHQRYLRSLEEMGVLNRALESLPDDAEIEARLTEGRGLTSPEFAVLLAYTKIVLTEQIVASDAPEDPTLSQALIEYFPTPLQRRFVKEMQAHRLHREIISTVLVNRMVNRAGTTFAYRLQEDTSAVPGSIMRAHAAAWGAFSMDDLWGGIEALDVVVSTDVQTAILLEGRRLVERATRWILQHQPTVDVAGTITCYADGVNEVSAHLERLLEGRDQEIFDSRKHAFMKAGIPEKLATRAAGLASIYSALDIVEVAINTELPVVAVAEVYFAIDTELGLSELRASIEALPREDRWQTLARGALRDDLFAAHASLTRAVLAAGDGGPRERWKLWREAHEQAVTRVTKVLADIEGAGRRDLATLSVALRQLRATSA